jgi:phospholipase/carboxylesterase
MPHSGGDPRLKTHEDLALSYLESAPAQDSAPLIIVLHGRGANKQDLAGLAPSIDPERRYRMIFPDAPRPFEPYPGMAFGLSWFDEWPPVPETLESSRDLLLRFIGELRERYSAAGKLALVGFSQGALMALDSGFRLPEPPAAIVAMSGGIDESLLPDLGGRVAQKVLLIHGTDDEMIPVVYARKTRRILEEKGLRPEYHEFAMGHWVTDESMAVVKAFLDGALG